MFVLELIVDEMCFDESHTISKLISVEKKNYKIVAKPY